MFFYNLIRQLFKYDRFSSWFQMTQLRPCIPTASRQQYGHFVAPAHFDSISGETSTSASKQKKPATYDGKSSWSIYLAQFEMTVSLNNWV